MKKHTKINVLLIFLMFAATFLGFGAFSSLKIEESQAEVASAVSANGGALYVGAGSTVTLNSSCEISGITGATNGGAIYVAGTLIIDGATISNCSATTGGAIYVANGGTVTMNSGTISGCTASDVGGAIFVAGGGNVAIKGGTISNCSASSFGGAILAEGSSSLNISGGTISGCEAERYEGGAIMASGAGFNFTGGTIKDCSAGSVGGGISLTSAINEVYFKGTITGCVSGDPQEDASIDGGALYSNGTDIYFDGATINGNNHNAVYFGNGTLDFQSGTISTAVASSEYLIELGGSATLNIRGGTIGVQGAGGQERIYSSSSNSTINCSSAGALKAIIDSNGTVKFSVNPTNIITISYRTTVTFTSSSYMDTSDFVADPYTSDGYEVKSSGLTIYLSSGYTVTIDVLDGAIESGYVYIDGQPSSGTVTGVAEGVEVEIGVYVESSYTSGYITTYYEGIIIINGTSYYQSSSGWFIKTTTITQDTTIVIDLDVWEEDNTPEAPHEVEISTSAVGLETIGTAWIEVDGTSYSFGDDIVAMSDLDFKVYFILDIANSGTYPVFSMYIDGSLWTQYCNDNESYMLEDVVSLNLEEYDSLDIYVEIWSSDEYIAIPKIEDLPQVDQEFEEVFFDDKKYFLKTLTTNSSNSVNIESEEKYIVKANITKIA